MKYLLPLLFFSLPAFAFKVDLSGNIEAQGRKTWNNEDAKKELFQDWDNSEFYMLYGNLGGKVDVKGGSRFEANWLVRHSYSELYSPENPAQDEYLVTNVFTFPRTLVARDIFKLQYEKQENNYRTDSVLNKFIYQWNFEEHRFTIGRMFINYGQGEIFNPLNPFNQPTALNSITNFAQGNDGVNFTFYANDKHTLNFYFLGDKSIENYEGQIDKTVWLHGEYSYSEQLQLDYVLGEDQNRHKIGGQFTYLADEAMIFGQLLYQSDYVNMKKSHNLWDILLGYDEQMNSKWHLRIEGGYQKRNRMQPEGFNLNNRFLPTEYFLAIANKYEIHPLVNLSGTIITDIKSGFTYLVAKSTFSLSHNTEAELFAFSPISKGEGEEFPVQKLVTTDVGLTLRAFF
ncbi:MAG TPA: hypothetical protein VKZ84_04370 [Bacteriovoracaceae bacterium]|nr:hypothetical protein [Bacteriovoracaceae bacterium]